MVVRMGGHQDGQGTVANQADSAMKLLHDLTWWQPALLLLGAAVVLWVMEALWRL